MTCPGCGGSKSKRALLCAACRRRAISVGVQEVLTPAPPDEPRSPSQNLAFHGKCATLAKLELSDDATHVAVNQRAMERKHDALAWAAKRFGRSIESSRQLSRDEMSEVLEWLDERQLQVASTVE